MGIFDLILVLLILFFAMDILDLTFSAVPLDHSRLDIIIIIAAKEIQYSL